MRTILLTIVPSILLVLFVVRIASFFVIYKNTPALRDAAISPFAFYLCVTLTALLVGRYLFPGKNSS